jgi:hypothetical protein
MNEETTKLLISSLYLAYNNMQGQARTQDAREALSELEDQIIDLENSLRDPEQDAERRMEINAAIAMSGNWGDNASDYMHTPMQERRYQQAIYDQVRREMDNECGHGWEDPNW